MLFDTCTCLFVEFIRFGEMCIGRSLKVIFQVDIVFDGSSPYRLG